MDEGQERPDLHITTLRLADAHDEHNGGMNTASNNSLLSSAPVAKPYSDPPGLWAGLEGFSALDPGGGAVQSSGEPFDEEELADTARSMVSPREECAASQQNGHWGPDYPHPGAAHGHKPMIGPRRGSQRRDSDDSSKSPSPSPDIGSMSISGPPSRTPSRCGDLAQSPVWKWKSGGGHPAAERQPLDGELIMPWPRLAEKKYQCIRSVGSGSFGEVFQARRLSDGKMVAVKVAASPAPRPSLAPDNSRPCWARHAKRLALVLPAGGATRGGSCGGFPSLR